ncbi:MAG TPA: nucleotidyltransferase family protein, partial [Bradyrhizobium sp.]
MDTDTFLATALRNPVNQAIADELFRLVLPDAWIVSRCLVQTAWNVLTGRAVDYGIDDYDVFYFDPDTSWQAEDAVIRQLQDRLARPGVKIETRNQARVHLW